LLDANIFDGILNTPRLCEIAPWPISSFAIPYIIPLI